MANYLLKRSNTYYFRWYFKDTEGYKQLKVSLQTSDHLKALNLSTHLALQFKSLINPCLSEIRLY
ncbi:hypothetical protein [Vibrio mediterranei]|uniref:hypothetical protein n=1 Tax=Vibrio mediterranei TaxID=689 RepID=UPI0022832F76|nr:hypothetical protein [Vibrio mediterranei]MCY9854075.1 hypothetical protein [Vibrio mediterranei]